MTPALLRRTLLGCLQTRFSHHPFSTGNPADIQDVVSVFVFSDNDDSCFSISIVYIY